MLPRFCYSLLVHILVVIGSISCKKADIKDEQTPLLGKAQYLSPLFSSKTAIPLAGQPIIVKDLQTTTVYPLVTDSMGLFFLPGLPLNRSYSIETSITKNDSDEYKVIYYAKESATGDQLKTVTLTAQIDTRQDKAFVISVTDEFGGRIPGSKVIVYTSRIVAKADTGFVGYAALANLTTDANGKCLFMQLPTDSLFIKSQFKVDKTLTLRSPKITALKLVEALTDTSIVIK